MSMIRRGLRIYVLEVEEMLGDVPVPTVLGIYSSNSKGSPLWKMMRRLDLHYERKPVMDVFAKEETLSAYVEHGKALAAWQKRHPFAKRFVYQYERDDFSVRSEVLR